MVEKYLAWYQENASENATDDEIKAHYKENKADFDLVNGRLFAFTYAEPTEESDDPVYTKKEAKEIAEEFLNQVSVPGDFYALSQKYAAPSAKENFEDVAATELGSVTKSAVSQSSEALANWLFDASRAVGDKAVVEDTENEMYYVVYLTSAAAPDRQTAGADVRHILVQAETTKTDTEGNKTDLSDAEIEANFAKAKTEAETILKEWKAGEATEESFSALAKEKTDDSGSKENGGLYEDITSTSSYVPEFLEWSLANHKVGDTGIVKTDYGYHIMYFVGADKTEKWESDVRSAIASEKYNNYTDKLHEKVEKEIDKNDFIINMFVKKLEDTTKMYANNLASSASSSSSITY